MEKKYFTQKNLKTKQFYVEPECDLGYDYDNDGLFDIIEIGEDLYGGLISIENMRKALDEFEKQGANYVNVYFHSDHNEVEVTGVIFNKATKEEIDAYIKKESEEKELQKAKEIARLQAEIQRIKSL